MKRTINGVAYNTDTATVLAVSEIADQGWTNGTGGDRSLLTLYQTRGGSFFVHRHTRTRRRSVRALWEEIDRDECEPMTPDQAQAWVRQDDVHLLNDVFGAQPAAAEDGDAATSTTLYIRVPAPLKDRLETLARKDGVSLNAWTLRCIERCTALPEIGERLSEIFATTDALRSKSAPDLQPDTLQKMIRQMDAQAVKIAWLLGWRGDALDALSSDGRGPSFHVSGPPAA
jgi:predicted HicB family RNase H-like nuclease